VPEKPPVTPRVFELRTYHSPTARQLKSLHERFSGAEIKIFHRVAFIPCCTRRPCRPGPAQPDYLTRSTRPAREKAWNALPSTKSGFAYA